LRAFMWSSVVTWSGEWGIQPERRVSPGPSPTAWAGVLATVAGQRHRPPCFHSRSCLPDSRSDVSAAAETSSNLPTASGTRAAATTPSNTCTSVCHTVGHGGWWHGPKAEPVPTTARRAGSPGGHLARCRRRPALLGGCGGRPPRGDRSRVVPGRGVRRVARPGDGVASGRECLAAWLVCELRARTSV
jgi:hypothetical protein